MERIHTTDEDNARETETSNSPRMFLKIAGQRIRHSKNASLGPSHREKKDLSSNTSLPHITLQLRSICPTWSNKKNGILLVKY